MAAYMLVISANSYFEPYNNFYKTIEIFIV